jgi:asparagine synthase (glutamine-hydrolysing)
MASWAIARDLNRGWTSYFLESLERDAAEWGLELRHPLYDRRIIEFALSLPEKQRRRGDVTKFVLRRAARLPPAVGTRTSKAELGSALSSLLAALGGRAFFERLRLADAGWVDAAEACRGYDVVCAAASPADRAASMLVARLWLLASIEVWFRACYDRSAL